MLENFKILTQPNKATPTYERPALNHKSIIDYILIKKNSNKLYQYEVLQRKLGSWHNIIKATIRLNKIPSTCKWGKTTITTFKVTEENKETYKANLDYYIETIPRTKETPDKEKEAQLETQRIINILKVRNMQEKQAKLSTTLTTQK
jgi:hypothetical protein